MADDRALLLDLNPILRDKLDAAAADLGRSTERIALEAIEQYLGEHDRQVEGIRRGIAALDCGQAVAHTEVASWVASWDSENERAKPKAP